MSTKNKEILRNGVCVIATCIFLFWGLPVGAQKQQDQRERALNVVKVSEDLPVLADYYEESHALLIGVSDYSHGNVWPNLPGVSKDIELIETTLVQLGFHVVKVINPTRSELNEAFDSFIAKYGLGLDNRLLIYFAGHGYTQRQAFGDEVGYIIPANTPDPTQDKSGFLRTAMNMQQIEVYAKQIQAKHVLFLFDSCFSGTIFSLSRAMPMPENIAYKIERPVRQFITSGSAYEKVPDESVFRGQFIAALQGEADFNRDGFVTGVELGMYLQDSVINYSEGQLHPQYGKIRHPMLDKGDFLFPLPNAEVLAELNQGFDQEIARLERERLEWSEKRARLLEERKKAQERFKLESMEKQRGLITEPSPEMCWDSEVMRDVPCN